MADCAGGFEYRLGPASQRAADSSAGGRDVVCPVGVAAGRARPRPEVVEQAEAWRQVAAIPAALPAAQPAVDTFATAGQLSVELDVETTRMLLGEVPAAFHAGVQDILLIAFGLALAQFLGTGGAPVGIDVEGHGRHEELGAEVDLSRTVGWFTTKYPVSLRLGWAVLGCMCWPVRRGWGR